MVDFFGKPIEGDITRYTERRAEQHDPKEMLDLLDAIVSLPHVEAVRWEGYTPSFNDGDPCVFSTGEFRIQLDINNEDSDDYDDGDYCDGFLNVGDLYDYNYDYRLPQRGMENATYEYKGVDTKDIVLAANAFAEVMDSHYDTMLQYFGDPFQVTYNGEGFQVEYYDCGH